MLRLCVQANPGKYALMICVELSSVHTTFDDNINDAILHAIFADGCAAAVLKGARKSECPKVCGVCGGRGRRYFSQTIFGWRGVVVDAVPGNLQTRWSCRGVSASAGAVYVLRAIVSRVEWGKGLLFLLLLSLKTAL